MSDKKKELWDAIAGVEDPEIGLSIVELGLIYDIVVDGSRADVTMTFTSMACPAGPQLQAGVHAAATSVEGIDDATVEVVFSPPWNPVEMASEEAKMMLGIY